VAQIFHILAHFSNLELLGILVGLSVAFGVASIFIPRLRPAGARAQPD